MRLSAVFHSLRYLQKSHLTLQHTHDQQISELQDIHILVCADGLERLPWLVLGYGYSRPCKGVFASKTQALHLSRVCNVDDQLRISALWSLVAVRRAVRPTCALHSRARGRQQHCKCVFWDSTSIVLDKIVPQNESGVSVSVPYATHVIRSSCTPSEISETPGAALRNPDHSMMDKPL